MSANEIHHKIHWILIYNFRVGNEYNLSTASFTKELNLNTWEINMLLYYIEQSLDIKLKRGLENEVDNINQLVYRISNDYSRKKIANRINYSIAS